jgi:hypothetical protein
MPRGRQLRAVYLLRLLRTELQSPSVDPESRFRLIIKLLCWLW